MRGWTQKSPAYHGQAINSLLGLPVTNVSCSLLIFPHSQYLLLKNELERQSSSKMRKLRIKNIKSLLKVIHKELPRF